MKTFKQHVKEGKSSMYVGDGAGVGTQVQNSVEDGSIADGEFLKPQQAVDTLREKLNRIGLTVSPVTMTGEKGKVTAEVKQFGGRFGKDTDGSDINDDGISHKKEGGLKLEVSYETLKNGTSKVYAKLV